MSKRAVVALESYRLAQYTLPVACYICGEANGHNAERCRHCGAPMALAHQSAAQKLRPRMIAVVGSASAGKTTYLGMLVDMLSRQQDGLQMLVRGAFSVAVQQATLEALCRDSFPAPTPTDPLDWNWLHCQVKPKGRRRPIELIIPDMAGTALQKEIDRAGTHPVVRTFLSQGAGAILLIDAAEVQSGQPGRDFFARKMVGYLHGLNEHRRKGWPNRPVAVVLTKADQCPACLEDPAQFTRKQAPSLWQQCRDRLRRHRFFAATIAGASAYRREFAARIHVPLRIEPRGVVPPLEWLLEQLA